MSAMINSSSAIRTFAIERLPKLEVGRVKRPPTCRCKLRNLLIKARNLPTATMGDASDHHPMQAFEGSWRSSQSQAICPNQALYILPLRSFPRLPLLSAPAFHLVDAPVQC